MNYPLSSDVQTGQTTLAGQYNNLRADVLRLGGNAADTATLQQLLMNYQCVEDLTASGTVITLNASAEHPCSLMISGQPAVNTEAVTLQLSAADFPQSAVLWLFAVKSADSIGFSLTVRISEASMTGECCIGCFLWDAERSLIQALQPQAVRRVTETMQQPQTCQGRLTLASNNPFPTSDISAASTLYFTPCTGNKISLYHPIAGWQMHTFSQLSCSLAGLQADFCYDTLIALDMSGNPALTLEPWSSLTVREQVIQWQDGIPVLGGAPQKRYLGTIGLSAAGTTRDTQNERNIWNFNHPVRRPLRKLCAVSQNPNPESNRWVPYAQDASLAVSMVLGMNHAEAVLHGLGDFSEPAANASALGIGIDIDPLDASMTVNVAELSALEYHGGSLLTTLQNRQPNRMLGKHRYNLITYTVNDTHTFNGSNYAQNACGLSGYMLG